MSNYAKPSAWLSGSVLHESKHSMPATSIADRDTQSEHLARAAVRGVGQRMHESYWETVLYGDGGEDTKHALEAADEAVEVADDPRASLETLRDVRVQHVMDDQLHSAAMHSPIVPETHPYHGSGKLGGCQCERGDITAARYTACNHAGRPTNPKTVLPCAGTRLAGSCC